MITPEHRPRILVLNDQMPFSDQIPNLGDRAHQCGLRTLAERCGGVELVSGTWKPFPYRDERAYRRAGADPRVFVAWERRARNYSATRAAVEARVLRWLPQWLPTGLMNRLDAVARRHTGLDLIAALAPRFLRACHARAFMAQLATARLALFNGGGLLADHLGRYLPERLFQLYLAKRAGLTVAAVNYSVSLAREDYRALAAPVLRSLDWHLVREPLSRAQLLELGVNPTRVAVVHDAAFYAPLGYWPVSGGEPALAMGIMVRGDRPVDLDAWAALVEALRRRFGVEVHFFQGCRKHDPPIRAALGRRCQLADDGRFVDYPELVAHLRSLRLLITERYHGVVFAALAGTPVVPVVATTPKTDGLLTLLDYPLRPLPPLPHAAVADYLKACAWALAHRESLSRQLAAAARRARDRLRDDYARLFRALVGGDSGDSRVESL